MSELSRTLVVSSSARQRLDAAHAWTEQVGSTVPMVVVAASRAAADDFLRTAAVARFGVSRSTVLQLASEIAGTSLAGDGRAPVHVFIHGGYWQQRTKDDFSFVAQGLVPLGAHTVVVNYALAPQVTMDEIVRQNRAALAWIWRNASDFGGPFGRGAPVAMVMAADWTAFGDRLPPDLIKGGCAISGLYDLEPIRLTYLNDAVGLDADAAARNSPVLHPPKRKAPIIVALGAEESEEYHRQAEDFVSVLRGREVPCDHFIVPGLNHYSIIDQFMRPDTPLSLAVGRQMGL